MQIYLVGGAVRDKLLNYPVYDKDWVVVGATAEQMIDLGYQPVGQDFPVFIHPNSGEEYALARTERKSGKGYTGFQYHASPDVTLEEDLLRRDLTINAMAMDDQEQLIDPYHGQQDLQNRCLRHVSPAFAEDPLRVLRVARFAARYHHLGFTVADETLQLMQQLSESDELEHLTAERIWKEFERALGETSPEVFLSLLRQCKATEKVFPEISPLIDQALIERLREISHKSDSTECRFAALLSLFPQLDITAFCDRLRTPKLFKELASNCQRYAAQLQNFDQLNGEEKLAVITGLDLIRRPQRLELLLPTVAALYPEVHHSRLQSILEQIDAIIPKELIAEGFRGGELGEEINRRRLLICQQ